MQLFTFEAWGVSPTGFDPSRTFVRSHFISPLVHGIIRALISIYCFTTITGALASVRIHGTMLSILFARAISIAAAEKGEGKRSEGCGVAGEVGEVVRWPSAGRSAGVIRGEEKQRR